tara:strand:+ start:8580 stop:9395 length:816 start_codon:yes stop_codon:yes gene_type:complete
MSALIHNSSSITFNHDTRLVRRSTRTNPQVIASAGPCNFAADSLTYKVAETRSERQKAFHLVYDVYRQAGLMSENASKMRVTKHHLLETTDVLIARKESDVLFTISSIRDGAYGLPLEQIFPDEVDAMRGEGLNLAEVSCVASKVPTSSKKLRFEILVKMMSIMAQQAQRNRVDRLLLAVHPRHAKVYQRLFGCKILSGEKSYAAVEDNPAVLCSHDFAELEIERYPLYDAIQGPSYDPWQLAGTRMSDDELEYFADALNQGTENLVPMAA